MPFDYRLEDLLEFAYDIVYRANRAKTLDEINDIAKEWQTYEVNPDAFTKRIESCLQRNRDRFNPI